MPKDEYDWLISMEVGRVPTHTGKPGKLFPVREKSGNFKILPKSWEILIQSGKSRRKLDKKYF